MQTRRLRILHADTDDLENPLRGGQPVRTFAVNSRLARRHDVLVFTSCYKGSVRQVERQGVRYRRLGFRIPGLGLSPHMSFMAALGPVVWRTPHDLVVEEFTPPVGFNGLPWWSKAPVVLIVQWHFFEQWEKRYRLPFTQWMERLAATKRYRHVVVQSQAMARTMSALLPDAKIRHIPPGIDEAAFLPTTEVGSYVLFLGRLDLHHKGLDLLIAAWKQMEALRRPPLVLAGEGPGRSWLEATIAEAGLSGSVKLVGRQEGGAKAQLLQGARLVVIPSRYETFGIVAAEAMAAGKPTVSFDIPHLNELVRAPWGTAVPAFEPAAFAGAVEALWDSPERCQNLGAQAREEAKRYHWDRLASEQEEFYLEAYHRQNEKA